VGAPSEENFEQSVVHDEGTMGGERDLRSKLRDLQVLRAEIDDDITSLQRVLAMMGGSP
jgi:hypothetical protein